MKPKVVFLHPDLGIGGAERLMVDCAYTLYLKKIPCRFVVNHHDRNHCFPETKEMIPVDVVGDWIPRHFFGRFQALLAYLRMLYMAIYYVLFMVNKDFPDVAIVDQIPIAVPILRLRGIPVIYYCHHPDLLASPPGGSLKKLYRMPIDWVEQYTTGLANVILVNSEYTKSIFKSTFPRIKSDVKILYPSVIEDQYKLEGKIKDLNDLVPGLTKEHKILVSINRFHAAKQLDIAVKAMSCLKKLIDCNKWDRVHLILAGGYDPENHANYMYYEYIEKLVVQSNLMTNVSMLKSPNHENKLRLLYGSNCIIYTPTKEHFGIVPLEAMVASKPVIAINSGGPRETIHDGVNGYLSEDTPEDLARCMSKILESDQKNTEMGKAGLKRFREKFDFETFSVKFNNVINELVRSYHGNKSDNVK